MIIMKLMFMNKILQIWKLSITETDSHHTVLTFKSFIEQYVMKKCYLFSCSKASKNVNFCNVFIPNFVQKKKNLL